MNSFLELAEKRYSCRKYKPDPLPEEYLDRLLRAAALAPTGYNLQPWRIMVIRSPKGLEELKSVTPYTFGAPCVLAVLACGSEGWTRKYDGKSCRVIDASIAATHIILQAADMGLGTCWVMSFDPAAFTRIFEPGADMEPVALIPVGFPADDAAPGPGHAASKDLKELVSYK